MPNAGSPSRAGSAGSQRDGHRAGGRAPSTHRQRARFPHTRTHSRAAACRRRPRSPGAAFDRSKKGPAQIKHWESITSRRWAQASGRFRLRATPAGISDPVVQKPRQAPAHTLIGAAAPLSGGHAGPSGIASDLCRHHRGCGGHGRGWVLRRMKPSVHSGTWLA